MKLLEANEQSQGLHPDQSEDLLGEMGEGGLQTPGTPLTPLATSPRSLGEH